ncbi:MAG: 2-hydroxy-3-oxopropionate reductase [Clostridiales bacterium]|nr:2-hydroxy-3-oxopropionate reductase [Clostridiales bacterium]
MNKIIGFIGLGIMGKPMSKNLLKAGYKLVVYDLNKDAVAEIVKAGALECEGPKDAAQRSDVIITMLPDSPQVEEVVLGAGGVLEGAKGGSVIIDMSSIAPLISKKIYYEAKKKSVRLIDAPVSGGEPRAIDGSLSIMVGGDQKDFDECYDMLCTMGKSVVRVGEIGSGNIAKLANQIMVALNIAAFSEALVLATKAGVDPEAVFNAVKGGLAGSNALNAKVPLIMDRKFEPGFKINLHIKDLKNALDTGRDIGVPLPLTSMVMEIMQALKVDGKGNCDHSALINFFEKLAGVEVKKQ